MTSRVRLLLTLVVAAALIALAACGGGASESTSWPGTPFPSSPSEGSLTYSVKPMCGGLSYAVSDTRPGRHTVWIVLLNPPKGVRRTLAALETDLSGSMHGGVLSLPPGTYRYAVYSVDGHFDEPGAVYWTVEHFVDKGEAWVP